MNDPWRYRCPNGHTSWQARQSDLVESGGAYYCIACKQNGIDPHFDELADAKTGKTVTEPTR